MGVEGSLHGGGVVGCGTSAREVKCSTKIHISYGKYNEKVTPLALYTTLGGYSSVDQFLLSGALFQLLLCFRMQKVSQKKVWF
jgi:hypothetical protein